MLGASSRSRRATVILLAVLVAASSCGGGEVPASDEDDEQAQELGQLLPDPAPLRAGPPASSTASMELGQLLPDPAPPPTLERPRERPVAARWPHCADYESLLAAIARLESAESAVEDAQEDLEEAEAAYRFNEMRP